MIQNIPWNNGLARRSAPFLEVEVIRAKHTTSLGHTGDTPFLHQPPLPSTRRNSSPPPLYKFSCLSSQILQHPTKQQCTPSHLRRKPLPSFLLKRYHLYPTSSHASPLDGIMSSCCVPSHVTIEPLPVSEENVSPTSSKGDAPPYLLGEKPPFPHLHRCLPSILPEHILRN